MRGIPFMKPPVDELRWKAPIIERSSEGYPRSQILNGEGVYLAEDATPSCPNAFNTNEDITEDCTYLDIFVPRKAIENKEKLKIFLYFHGGAFLGGYNRVISPNKGSIIALEQNIVVVSANYRLGAFGFLFSNLLDDQIDKEFGLEYYDGKVTSGNQGLMDQQMAMIWTGEFSKYFAGDKDDITIGGMSAGGQSVHAHLVMPSSEKLFHKAIAFSGPNGIPYYNDTEGEDILQGIAQLTECCEAPEGLEGLDSIIPQCAGPTTPAILECMMAKSTVDINTAAWRLRQAAPIGNFDRLTMIAEPYAPIINTGMLREEPYYYFQNGELHDKPTIIDVADNEGYGFVEPVLNGLICPESVPAEQHVCEESWDAFLGWLLKDNFEAVKEAGFYNCPEDGSECLDKADEFLTDFTWYCNARRCLEDGYPAQSTGNRRFGRNTRETGMYIARVSQRLPWDPVEEGVRHGVGEHWYFHDALRNDPKYAADKPFQYSYVQYLSNFIRTGDPNNYLGNPVENAHKEQANWDEWSVANQWLDVGAEASRGFQMQTSDPRTARCDFLDSLDLYMTI